MKYNKSRTFRKNKGNFARKPDDFLTQMSYSSDQKLFRYFTKEKRAELSVAPENAKFSYKTTFGTSNLKCSHKEKNKRAHFPGKTENRWPLIYLEEN